jgi:calcium-dependent protein kinase
MGVCISHCKIFDNNEDNNELVSSNVNNNNNFNNNDEQKKHNRNNYSEFTDDKKIFFSPDSSIIKNNNTNNLNNNNNNNNSNFKINHFKINDNVNNKEENNKVEEDINNSINKNSFKRNKKRFKTIDTLKLNLSLANKKQIEKSIDNAFSPASSKKNIFKNDDNSPTKNGKFQRNKTRSTTLIEKSKNNKIFKDEFNLSVSGRLFINEVKEVPHKKYKILSKLGTGAYGTVYLAQNVLTKINVAMKRIDKDSEDLLTDNEIMDEIEILKKLAHPDIVKIIEFYNTRDAYYIINDYCEDGELYNQITKRFNETQIAVMFKQIFSGLSYLHSNNIIHRDLKLENILISDIEKIDGLELFDIKIIDFGTAKLYDKAHKKQKAIVGSSYYIAPEVLKRNYDEKCDMWSCGVILYMLLVGHAPFDGETDNDIIKSIKVGVYKTNEERYVNGSEELKDLITKLLKIDPKERISAKEALNHNFFIKANANLIYQNISKDLILSFIHNLLSYRINSKFQEMVLAYIIHNMPKPKGSKDAIKLFFIFNEGGDGKLTKEELKDGLLNFVTEDYLNNFDDIFLQLDGAKHGYLEYEEFLRAVLDKKEALTEETLIYAFNFFDKGTGYITMDNIKQYFIGERINEEVFKTIFDEIDENKSGKIGFQEFKDMMTFD